MRLAARGLLLGFMLCAVAASCWSSDSDAASLPQLAGSSVLDGGLVIPAVQALDEGEQERDAEQARRSNPVAVVAREVSRTAYRHLTTAQALRVARQLFPSLIEGEEDGPLRLSAGQRITGYPADNAAQVAFPDNRHGLIVSTQPLAVEVSRNRRVPVNLGLRYTAGGFAPSMPAVGVRIPRRLDDGVTLSSSGVSLTPLDARGIPLDGSEGSLDGATVLYANTQTSMDTLVKPVADGFEMDSMLRSPESPGQLVFRVGLPRGSHLVGERGSGGASVVEGDTVIARVAAPRAVDAEGTPVVTSTTVVGDLIKVTVADRAGAHRYPIAVDPTVEENVEGKGKILFGKTWGFTTDDSSFFHEHEEEFGEDIYADRMEGSAPAGDYGTFYYKTQGESRIYSLTATTSAFSWGRVEDVLGILNPHSRSLEAEHVWREGSYGEVTTTLCSPECGGGGNVTSSNDESEAVYKQDLRESATNEDGDAILVSAKVGILQTSAPSAAWDTTDETLKGEGGKSEPNAMTPGRWISTAHNYPAALDGFDPGVGIARISWRSPNDPGWGSEEVDRPADGAIQMHECEEAKCGGSPLVIGGGSGLAQHELGGLPEGEDTVEGTVEDGVGMKTTATGTVKVDDKSPYEVHLVGLPSNNEIGLGFDRLEAHASEGSGTAPSPGIASMRLFIDGREIGRPNGSCSAPTGPCTAEGEWEINGEEFAAGEHEVWVVAESGAGDTRLERTTITFVGSESRPVGPGSVTLASGTFRLASRDVSVAASGSGLSVQRVYDSRLVDTDSESPFGPQWQGLSVTGDEQLTKLPTGSVVLTASSGQTSVFTREGSGFVAPTGDSSLTLKEESPSAFALSDPHGDLTRFAVPEGGSGTVLMPVSREEPGHSGAATYRFQTVGGVTEPTEALASPPAGVSCATLVRGCRALTFGYATKTTASGETPSEWGEYAGRLMKVYFTAYNPTTKAMQTTAVAQYAYDKLGRLRAEWDPRIEPALKTTYGYDAEGHVTAVTPPGQQPWLLHYGTIESDPTSGRLLSVSRPSPSTPLAQNGVPVDQVAPKLSSTSPVRGSELTVTSGTWSNSPLSYGYQWERCNGSGTECTAIPGATDQGYTPRYDDDEGHTFVVLVTATNGGGSATAATAASAPLAVIPPDDFPRQYEGTLGSKGKGDGEFESPSYDAYVASSGTLYVTDTGNNRVEYFREGGYVGSLGVKESEQLKEPTGIAALQYDNEKLSVVDAGHKRVVNYENHTSFKPPPEYLGETANPDALAGTAVYESEVKSDNDELLGEVLVADDTTNHIDLGGLSGDYFGATGSGPGQFDDPADVAVSPTNGYIYVLDTGNDRVEYFNAAPGHLYEYLGQFGEAGSKLGQFKEPKGIAVDPDGDVWVADTGNGRVEQFSPTGEPIRTFGEPSVVIEEKRKEKAKEREEREAKELAPEHFNKPIGITFDGAGGMYVVDSGNDRIQMWARAVRPPEPRLPPATPPSPGSTAVWTIDYQVPVSGSGAPYSFDGEELTKLEQHDYPLEGTAIFPPDEPMGWPAKDYDRASIYYLDSKDRTVNTAIPGGGISTQEYNTQNDLVRALSADDRAQALKEGSNGMDLSTLNTYNSEGTELLSSTGPEHKVIPANGGKEVTARKVTKYSYDEGAPTEGGPYALVTKQTTAALNMATNEEEDPRTTTTAYSGQEGVGWKLRKPTSVTADVGALNLTHTTLYEAESGNVSETRTPADTTEKSPHATETVYYTAGANAKVAACGEHPEWAMLPCETRPAKQPETAGLPGLPVTSVTYNIWQEPETITETVEVENDKNTEMVTRTKNMTYDAAGRPITTSTTSSVGKPLPSVIDEYSPATGLLVTQSTTSEGTTRKITSEYNSLAQLTAYTDADGNTSSYSYDIDGRPETIDDGKGTQTYSYDPTTGEMTKLVDSAAGTFTASYDPEGSMSTEGYPNGMTAKYTRNALGEPITLEYVKTSDCTSECTWYSDSVVPSIEGQWMSQTSSLSSDTYTHDGEGRLTEVKTTPIGRGCTTHVYTYDADSNRTSLTTRPPKETGKCATKGGTVETHSYDEADRLIDPGVAYSAFGDITALPAADAGGSELTSSYYVDNQLQSTSQHEQTIGYNLDPEGRIRETVQTGKLKNTDIINHYPGPGNTPAWTTNTSGEWTRDITGIDGQLAAVQSNGETPVLQLANLHGDIVATAQDSETATGLASTIGEPGEYGVPASEAPAKYSWLGAIQIPTELPSGVTNMGVRTYVPQLGRFLQPDPDPSGSPNAYAYTFGDPLNETDQTGQYAEYTIGGPSAALLEWAARSSQEAAAQQAAENAAARAAAERAAQEALGEELTAYGPDAEGGEEWWEEWEEEGEYESEYVGYHSGAKPATDETHASTALFLRPLGEAGRVSQSQSMVLAGATVSLCREAEGQCVLFASETKHKKKRIRHLWGPGFTEKQAKEVAEDCERKMGDSSCASGIEGHLAW
jgi:RHS repeat-associated protein